MGDRGSAGSTVTVTFITVMADEHQELPEGCCMRFKAIGTPRVVRRVRLDGDGLADEWMVESCDERDEAGPALGVAVEDSNGGASTLVYGAAHGLRLRPASGESDEKAAIAEPYLVLADRAVVE
jgi:hypothetical protein